MLYTAIYPITYEIQDTGFDVVDKDEGVSVGISIGIGIGIVVKRTWNVAWRIDRITSR